MSSTENTVFTSVAVPDDGYAQLEPARTLDAGTIRLGSGVTVPGPIYGTQDGISLGPLHLTTQTDAAVSVDGAEFRTAEPSLLDRYLPDVETPDLFDEDNETATNNTTAAGVGAAAMAGAASADDETDDPRLTRRELLVTAGAAVGGLAMTGRGAADTETIHVADLDLRDATSPVEIRLSPAVANVLPQAPGYDLVVGGTTAGRITAGSPAVVIPQDWLSDGPTAVTLTRDAGVLADLQALWSDPTLTYTMDVPDAKTLAAGSDLVLTKDRLIAEPVARTGGNPTTLTIGDTSIPHRSEDREAAVGWYATRERDGRTELIYHVGEQAPSATTANLGIKVGLLAEVEDDLSRVI